MGQLARLTLRYSGQPAHRAAWWWLPSHLPENRAVGEHFRFYEREGRFYEQIGGRSRSARPAATGATSTPPPPPYGLLLEGPRRAHHDQPDRRPRRRSGRAGPARAGQAPRRWWASPALDGLTWMPRLDDPVNLAAASKYRDAWPLFVERIGDAVPAEALALGEQVKEQYESLLVVGTAGAPLTICHGDFRADNLMFDDAPRPRTPSRCSTGRSASGGRP